MNHITLLLTSSPCAEGHGDINPANGFAERLLQVIPRPAHGLFIASSPDDVAMTEYAGIGMKEALAEAGVNFISYKLLHSGTAHETEKLVRGADFIILGGGHVPTQNTFFQRIGLKQLLSGWEGLVMGISAGSMNCATTVYAMPELEGETLNPFYHRFMPGLELTDIQIIPHFQRLRHEILDGKRMLEDIGLHDSTGHTFYALADGSYILSRNGREELFGPAWVLSGGQIKTANHAGESLLLHERIR